MPARIDWTGLLADVLVTVVSGYMLALLIHLTYLRFGSK